MTSAAGTRAHWEEQTCGQLHPPRDENADDSDPIPCDADVNLSARMRLLVWKSRNTPEIGMPTVPIYGYGRKDYGNVTGTGSLYPYRMNGIGQA